MNLLIKIKNKIQWEYKKYDLKNKPKIFCIGRNKTGTTSFKKAFQDLGFYVGNQRRAEKLLYEYKAQNFQPIVDYCKTTQVFQDFPFSFPETYKHLDKAFPDAKSVLTIRDSPEQGYDSYIRHQTKLFGKNGKLPTIQDLKNAPYVWEGWSWEIKNIYRRITSNKEIYDKDRYIKNYIRHNRNVKKYFKGQPEKLVIINLAQEKSYGRLMEFLDIDSPYEKFPWENRTA